MGPINNEKLEKHFRQFDPFEFKYKTILDYEKERYKKNKKRRLKRLREFQVYENSQQFSALTECTYDNMKENLDMIYSDKELTKLIIKLYEMINGKIIQQYINVDGLERLFSEKYANFEWEMHLGMDHDEHSMTYYRDHFVHQIRDAYTMDELLSKHGFLEKISNILSNPGNGPISMYVCNMIDQQLFKRSIIFNSVDKRTLKEHFLRNIIYMSSYMAGLFHDIGYPVVMNMNENRKIIDYLAEMYVFKGGSYNFNRITSLLQNSLLFRVVRPKEIRKRIEGDKPDHGVVSALLFLLHFYENGAIYRLEPYKLCTIELAALAIYNHTNKYRVLGQKHPNYEKCVFALNPISYLLRVADDLQEWGRIYFEISKKSQIMLCSKCHMPVIPLSNKSYGSKTSLICQSCNCKSYECDALFAYDNFPRRKLYNVTVCKNLEIKGDFNEIGNTKIFLDYRMDRLLQIAFISPKYAEHCIEELNHMKRLFISQYKMGVVFVDYFITNNIIFIKSRIVGEYYDKIMNLRNDTGYSEIKKGIKDLLSQEGSDKFKLRVMVICGWIENYILNSLSGFGELKKGKLKEYLNKVFSIYLGIYLLTESVKELNASDKHGDRFLRHGLRKFGVFYLKQYPHFYGNATMEMLLDIAIQIEKLYCNLDEFRVYPNKYFYAFEYSESEYGETKAKRKKKKLRNAIKDFTDANEYSKSVRKDEQYDQINAFSDLYWIRKMILELRMNDEDKYEV